MSDPEVPQNDQPTNINDVVGSANEGLDAAAAARADVPGTASDADAVDSERIDSEQPERIDSGRSEPEYVEHDHADPGHADPDQAAFAAAEADYPGTFAAPESAAGDAARADAYRGEEPRNDFGVDDPTDAVSASWREPEAVASESNAASGEPLAAESAITYDPTPTVADQAYATGATATAAETQVMPAEPMAPPAAPQPIFVQAPEPPRDLGNRGAAGAIGLIATLAFAVLYLAATLGLGALAGDVTAENIGTSALAPLTTWSFWVPVVVFFLAFWLLGAFVNRARWGKWVILGLLVAVATYGGHLLGQLFQAPFWRITASESADLVNEQLLAPLAIAAFVIARELTIWFGAWVSRSGARKKVLNAEAQAEYERTLEAGPSVAVR